MKMILLTLAVAISACAESSSSEIENLAEAILDQQHVSADLEIRFHEAHETDTCSFETTAHNNDLWVVENPSVDGEAVTGFTGYDAEGYPRVRGVICRLTDVGNLYGTLTWSN